LGNPPSQMLRRAFCWLGRFGLRRAKVPPAGLQRTPVRTEPLRGAKRRCGSDRAPRSLSRCWTG